MRSDSQPTIGEHATGSPREPQDGITENCKRCAEGYAPTWRSGWFWRPVADIAAGLERMSA